jgi:ribosome-associated protein YbcJ (S4-like RNA binding protein)
MASPESPVPRAVTVSETPIELCQFLKFGGLAGSGVVETRKRKKLSAGDVVTFAGQAIVVVC